MKFATQGSIRRNAPSQYELYQALFSDGRQVGENLMIASRLFSRDTTASNHVEVAEILVNCTASFKYVCHQTHSAESVVQFDIIIIRSIITGGKVSQFPADSARLNPA